MKRILSTLAILSSTAGFSQLATTVTTDSICACITEKTASTEGDISKEDLNFCIGLAMTQNMSELYRELGLPPHTAESKAAAKEAVLTKLEERCDAYTPEE